MSEKSLVVLGALVRACETGIPPTYRELANMVGYISTNTVARHLHLLAEGGLVEPADGLARMTVPTPQGRERVRCCCLEREGDNPKCYQHNQVKPIVRIVMTKGHSAQKGQPKKPARKVEKCACGRPLSTEPYMRGRKECLGCAQRRLRAGKASIYMTSPAEREKAADYRRRRRMEGKVS